MGTVGKIEIFNQVDAIKAVTIGFDKQDPLMDPKLWTEDFTMAWTGRSYTPNIHRKIEPVIYTF